jgi:hypothetical protein
MSCLFNSLSKFIDVSPIELRKNIVHYLSQNPILHDDNKASELTLWTDDLPLSEYIKKMSHPDTWGGAIEIKAFCNLYKVTVVVKYTFNEKTTTFTNINNICLFTIYILYNGGHYSPMGRSFCQIDSSRQ